MIPQRAGPLDTVTTLSGRGIDYGYGHEFLISFTYAGGTHAYGYDDRLVVSAAPFAISRRADNALPTTVTAPGFSLSRAYNAFGEIDEADYGAYCYTLTSTFDAEDRATHAGDVTYTYTPDGYLAAKHSSEGTTTYAYSAFGELESVTLADGRDVSYTYDAAGRRTSKAIDRTVTERYVWADTTRLLAVYDRAGTLQMRFLYADARVPYAADTPQGRIFFAYDQVGSLRAVSDEAGTVLKRLTHDSYGNVISDSNPALDIPLGFAGGLTDPHTGLTLFGARDYDPTLGRWIAKDPIGFAGGDANLYGYCLGDPVNLVDPSGLRVDPGGGAGAEASRRYEALQRLATMDMTATQRAIAEDIIRNGAAETIHKSRLAYTLEGMQAAITADMIVVAVAAALVASEGILAVPLAYAGGSLAVGGAGVAGARCLADSEVNVLEAAVDGISAATPLGGGKGGVLAWGIWQTIAAVDPDAPGERPARIYVR